METYQNREPMKSGNDLARKDYKAFPVVEALTEADRFSGGGSEGGRVLRWLAGCLEMRSGDRVVEEHRMDLRAGSMLGMGRTTSVIAWIDGTQGGKRQRIEFPYSRVACPAAQRSEVTR